jgi:hypothetical protein
MPGRGDRDEVDEVRTVRVNQPAESGDPAAEGARVGLRIGNFQPAGAGGQEPDAFAAGAGDLDDAVANFGDAAIHDADDIDQASGAAREQRAAIGDAAAHDRGAAARGLNDRARTECAAAQRQGAGR